ncbi:hypothetical protein P43SY_002844 [Pythium insidiosum]|uniref:Uncharacterized protein n=1 Tax=Pythium insidiosum TaxID=114742 RepID=A0AAD5LPT9_PYTIN|nr:hypothetical protein P43SY_002844 [Pythium insidiosum]
MTRRARFDAKENTGRARWPRTPQTLLVALGLTLVLCITLPWSWPAASSSTPVVLANVGSSKIRTSESSTGMDRDPPRGTDRSETETLKATRAPVVDERPRRRVIVDEPASTETWPMMDQFYTSQFDENDTSTTIIFNVFKGRPDALAMQLEAALAQEEVAPPDVWVMSFNSPQEAAFRAVVDRINARGGKSNVLFTASPFNFKFHGRFLLAYMAQTKYVLVVDDDKMIDGTTVRDYIRYMKKKPGLWGNMGHLRATTFQGYKSWPSIGYDLSVLDFAEQEYLCGMWFFEQRWLEYFMKERMPTWATSEDMHFSHVMRKYLNLNTYGGKVALNSRGLPTKSHTATVGKALDLREYVWDHQLGRGNKVANVPQPIKTLVYVERVADITDFEVKLRSCTGDADQTAIPWCSAGKTAVVFRGSEEQDVQGLIKAAVRLCLATDCEYYSVKPQIQHVIRYFNMREGYGEKGVDVPYQTGASDVLTSLTGILNNLLPEMLFIPDVSELAWKEDPGSSKRNRLAIYNNVVRLAVQIHLNTKSNVKWDDRDRVAAGSDLRYPSMKVYQWQHNRASVPPAALVEILEI